MKPSHLLAMSAALLIAPASAQAQRSSGPWMPPRSPPTPQQLGGNFHGGFHGGHHGFFPGFFPGYYVETEVVHDVVVVHDQPAEPAAPPAPPPPPRKPWVMGKSYASLPPGCGKLIEDGGKATYYHCSGEWYRQVGPGQYKAVSAPL